MRKPTKNQNIKNQIKNLKEYVDNCTVDRKNIDGCTVKTGLVVLESLIFGGVDNYESI